MRLLHFSEDPTIERFVPVDEFVWAMDEEHAPLYWFPRECPRATFWPDSEPTRAQLALLGGRRRRVHAIEWAWLERVRRCELWVYDLEPSSFVHRENGMWVSESPVEPLGVAPVGDLLARHREARIELRLVDNLWPLWELVTSSGLNFSGVRLRNAAPPPANYRGPLPQ